MVQTVVCRLVLVPLLAGCAAQAPSPPSPRVPDEWELLVDDESIVVSVLMEPGDPPTVTATSNGCDVEYVATTAARRLRPVPAL